jgi:hypothetical protein
MEAETERPDAVVGFTRIEVEGETYIRNPNGDLRRLSDRAVALLEKLATGELPEDDLEGTPKELVGQLREEGYLRPDEPVVRLVPPDDIRLWPRVVAFVVLFGLSLFGIWTVLPGVFSTDGIFSDPALYAPETIGLVAVLVALTVAIHELGHCLASKPFLDPSLRLGFVNGVLLTVVTDATEAWMLPRNRRRWITLAGPFVEVVWLLVVLAIYVLLLPGNLVLEVTMVASVSQLLFSLNPLIHGDGYLLMIDTFDVVDLRTRGTADLRERNASLAAGYVVLSYGFGVFVLLSTLLYAADFFDLFAYF